MSPSLIAMVCVGLDRREHAFRWLMSALDARDDHLLDLAADPVYDPLRPDPRFRKLLAGVGLGVHGVPRLAPGQAR